MSDTDDHKNKMKEVQAKHREKVAEATDPGRGLILVHTGKGKGKSAGRPQAKTAAKKTKNRSNAKRRQP